ncbi:hypothetical protein MtrunA17_Chr1g0202991 [Medicago truncatula]|uniref:Uncharacterized protein n=1 Tax=Medicago truncatula TaxID=3880 RepID=A0A396K1A5_MEDTR|nr:hypothetical protein MtrunA17_Chr1g0202991 [Medicago truncatula]
MIFVGGNSSKGSPRRRHVPSYESPRSLSSSDNNYEVIKNRAHIKHNHILSGGHIKHLTTKSDGWGLILFIRDVIGAFYSLLRLTYKDYVVFLHIVALIVLSVF